MQDQKKIKSALISVFHKDGLEDIAAKLKELDIQVYSTGGTQKFLESQGLQVHRVEDLTGYPSILDGRVKTLHPKVFGGILAKRDEDHLGQLNQYDIPEIDLVVVDLYPFEETVASTSDENAIIEKIDIGGIALIRAAAKNFNDTVIVPSKSEYADLLNILNNGGSTDKATRLKLAKAAFYVSSHYDSAIFNYFASQDEEETAAFKVSIKDSQMLRYGENPHQQGFYYGNLDAQFHTLSGKALSFNNLVDVDAAVAIMKEFKDEKPTFAVLKHTNTCGIATRDSIFEAWQDALAGDPISAFGGILIANAPIDLKTAEAIDKIFYEVLIAPAFDDDAKELLTKKSKRILLQIKHWDLQARSFKSILNGVISQDTDLINTDEEKLRVVTEAQPTEEQLNDLNFANRCVKHLKSNTIVLVKNNQLIGMGCGQTSRVDACKQAIDKAQKMGFDTHGSVMASDAFFPFPDCVEIASNAGIKAVIQPGGSIKDKLSIDFCNEKQIPMLFTGLRHFKH